MVLLVEHRNYLVQHCSLGLTFVFNGLEGFYFDGIVAGMRIAEIVGLGRGLDGCLVVVGVLLGKLL